MSTKPLYLKIGTCSALHLMVDGLCLCCLYLLAPALSAQRLVVIFLTYNMLAFLSQPLTGMWVDRMKQRHWMLLASVMLLALAVLATAVAATRSFSTIGIPVVAILLGMGNSLFHVWGGKQVATETGNDIRMLGAFVATGALGLSIGYVFFSWLLLCFLVLAISLLSVFYITIDKESIEATSRSTSTKHSFSTSLISLILLALMTAVMLRSLIGETFTIGLPKSNAIVLLIGGVSMLGKMAGGWIAHRFGIISTLVSVMLLALACHLCRNQGMVVFFVGLFAVNCTMPITLYLANMVLPGREGLAFGLLAAALIPGYLISTL